VAREDAACDAASVPGRLADACTGGSSKLAAEAAVLCDVIAASTFAEAAPALFNV
jgi:hypothetical protein